MPGTAQVGSIFIGTCKCHETPRPVTGIVITGSSDHTVEGLPVARVGDIVVASCNDSAIIISGKPTNTTNSLQKGEVGSVAVGCPIGIIVTGSITSS